VADGEWRACERHTTALPIERVVSDREGGNAAAGGAARRRLPRRTRYADVQRRTAVDGTWSGPGAEWTDGTNWSSTPDVPDDTATFTDNGAPTSVTISSAADINTIQFDVAAPAYAFTNSDTFNVNGAGIVNNSAFAPTFTNTGSFAFNNASTAGNAVIINNGALSFNATSTAANAIITTNDGARFHSSIASSAHIALSASNR
jgi:hypothetical protein